MDSKKVGSSLDFLVSSFNARVAELQHLVIARNMFPASSISDLSAVDSAVTALELELQNIKNRLREETEAIPKAKKLIKESLWQQKKLQNLSAIIPPLPSYVTKTTEDATKCAHPGQGGNDFGLASLKIDEPTPKEKKGCASPPLFYINDEELNSVPSYMKQRLTLEKVNAALNDMATYAEATAQLLAAPRNKLTEKVMERAMELRDIAATEGVKGKHFFLETDIKGPSLKLDHTGKAILTVLRHLGRLSEARIGHHRVLILLRLH